MLNDAEHVKVRVLPDGRVSRREAAKIFGRSAKTLAEWKMKGWGPRPIIVGGRIFHDLTECLEMARGEKPIAPLAA
ncbi:DNA-binding protein [Novosphingobium bradum]|uniref:DNA-binding protein n=1 Tax=Novosphingobium bradum TaxID=1737444 RepID=A0ABV7IQT4_9SPHN